MTARLRPCWRRSILLGSIAFTLGAAVAPPTRAAPSDHELARQALENGKVLPLSTVLAKVEHDYPGQPLKIEFEREHGRFIYEIRLLQPDGRIAKLRVDAFNGQLISVQRKDTDKDKDND